MTNLEKLYRRLEPTEPAGFSAVLIGARPALLAGVDRQESVIFRLEELPATPNNVERMRMKIRQLNRRLAASNAPFRLRVI